jgi:hypothetical protein
LGWGVSIKNTKKNAETATRKNRKPPIFNLTLESSKKYYTPSNTPFPGVVSFGILEKLAESFSSGVLF